MSASAKDRVVEAKWVLERQLAWVAAAEVKAGAVVTIQVAMLGGLGAAYASAQTKTAWATGASVACLFFAVVSIFCAAVSMYPRTDGPKKSLLFFGVVSQGRAEDYHLNFAAASDEDLLADWTAQVHRNAQIALIKHRWVGRALMMTFMSTLPWLVAVGALVLH